MAHLAAVRGEMAVSRPFAGGPFSALCSRRLTTQRMGEDAPLLPFAIPAGIGSNGWNPDICAVVKSRTYVQPRNSLMRNLPINQGINHRRAATLRSRAP
jgi:hypothetical protein